MEKTTRETTTILRLGPGDHGRPLSREECESAHYQEGYHYELIEGKLYVSPLPDPPHESLENWLGKRLDAYVESHRAVLNRISHAARVFVPGEEERTCPEPDQAGYEDYPFHIPKRERDWRQIHPLFVVVIVSVDDPDKDLVRNVAIYLRVPSIREYWVLDPRADPDYPELLVYRRRGRRWQRPIRVPGGGTYTTRTLPGFSLVLDAREA